MIAPEDRLDVIPVACEVCDGMRLLSPETVRGLGDGPFYCSEACERLGAGGGPPDGEAKMQVASTILAQLGGLGFMAMIGMKKPALALEGGVSFAFKAKARDGINSVEITLDWTDTYTMVFRRVTTRKGERKFTVVGTWDDVFCDQLVDRFEEVTGLAARMPRIFRH